VTVATDLPMIADGLRALAVPIESVNLDPANARVHGEKNLAVIRSSLQMFGQRKPVVVQRQGMVVRAGNGTVTAARALGWTHIAAVVVDDDNATAVQFAIADNRSSDLSEFDPDALSLHLQGMDDSLRSTMGFDQADVDELLRDTTPSVAEVNDDGPEPPPATATSRRGDIWLLGDHRLLCGDSTKPEDVARVLDGARAALFSTDPPYCVDYTGNDRPTSEDGKPSGKDWSNVYREVDIKDLGEFLDRVLAACLPHVRDEAGIYMWHAHVQQPAIAATFERHGLLLHQVLVWVKPSATFGHAYYRWRHEPCAFGWKRGHKPQHGFGSLETVWEADWDGKAKFTTFHPTSKPTRLFEIPMEQHTVPGAVVLEPFNGSGSQIIAAEKLGRRCCAIEISPPFVDGTILRWEKATGRTATLEDGRTFAAVAAERAAAMG
jgi:DNA modification methylase